MRKSLLALGFILVLTATAQAKGRRFRIVDGDSEVPIAGVTLQRWASSWQPCTIPWLGCRRFWFPEGKKVMTDSEGFVSLEKVARDDRYIIKVDGYEQETIVRGWFRFQFATRPKGSPRDVVEQSGTLVIPLRSCGVKAANPKNDVNEGHFGNQGY